MELHYLFKLLPNITIARARRHLNKTSLQNIYLIEDPLEEETLIGGFSNFEIAYDEKLLLLLKKELPNIDWNLQSQEFSPYYQGGEIHIELEGQGTKTALRLLPGEGFGDLSHPTTQIMLELLPAETLNKVILDIGCGNGVLALASKLLGAKTALGVDIDPKAIDHAHNNLAINKISDVSFYLPEHLPVSCVDLILCNMTIGEQETALKCYPHLSDATTLIVSGLLKAQKTKALNLYKAFGFHLSAHLEKDGWLGLILRKL